MVKSNIKGKAKREKHSNHKQSLKSGKTGDEATVSVQ